jgi:transposase-like protein
MKKVVLKFPDTARMAEFILTYRIGNAETNTRQCTLYAHVTEMQIVIACTEYEALLQKFEPAVHVDTVRFSSKERIDPFDRRHFSF